MASFKAKFPVLQELFAKNHRGPFALPPSGARVKHWYYQKILKGTPGKATGISKRSPIDVIYRGKPPRRTEEGHRVDGGPDGAVSSGLAGGEEPGVCLVGDAAADGAAGHAGGGQLGGRRRLERVQHHRQRETDVRLTHLRHVWRSEGRGR